MGSEETRAQTSAAQPGDVGGATAEHSRGRLLAAALLAALVVVLLAFGAGWVAARGEPTPTTTSAAAGFARDMQTHHEQAVEMALTVLTRSSDPDFQRLAYDMAASQSHQAGQLYGYLNEWGLPQASRQRPMEWMLLPAVDGSGGSMADHSMRGSSDGVVPERMPGLATPEQLAELRNASGVEAERIFLSLMIAHHEGGVAMAEAVLQRSNVPVIAAFAQSVITAQSSEIDYMRGLLNARSDPTSR